VSSNASSQATVPIGYLIRPDGYVALAAPANDAEALRRYLARPVLRALKPAVEPSTV
jgi:hypothetical protein